MQINDKLIKEFATFLHERGALDRFIHNLEHHPCIDAECTVSSWVSLIWWLDTPEGEDYWSRVANDWWVFCKENELC